MLRPSVEIMILYYHIRVGVDEGISHGLLVLVWEGANARVLSCWLVRFVRNWVPDKVKEMLWLEC